MKFSIIIFFILYFFSFSICQEKITTSFSINKKRIEIYIANEAKDSLFLPSQAYWEILPDSSYELHSDSIKIILERVKGKVEAHNAVVSNADDLYFADYMVPPRTTRILEFSLRKWRKKKKIKPRFIKWVVIEWEDGKLVGHKE